jgi:PAS domain S-box-containing protein
MKHPELQHASREVSLGANELIITKTDTRGHITYANPVFMHIAGYTETQLLGQPHNIIRHPDMPRGAFRLMWKTLQAGSEFFGVVKNYTSDGNYYWVFANITPDYGPDQSLTGYFSVRRQADRKAIEAVQPVYAEMCRIESRHSKSEAADVSMNWLLEQMKQQGTDYEQFILGLNPSCFPAKGGVA